MKRLVQFFRKNLFKKRYQFSGIELNFFVLFAFVVFVLLFIGVSKFLLFDSYAVSEVSKVVTSDTDFGSGTFDGTVVSGSGDGGLVSLGESYYKEIEIQSSQVDANLIDYPMTFITTDPDIKSVGNGGNVQNVITGGASGSVSVPADLFFAPDSSCDVSSRLDHEVELYDASTGELVVHVRIPSLSASSNTSVFMCYGNPDITSSQENVQGVWDENYVGVWHLNSSSGSFYDSTTNSNNSIYSINANILSDGIGYSIVFTGDGYIVIPNSPSLDIVNEISLTFWTKTNISPGTHKEIITRGSDYLEAHIGGDNGLEGYIGSGAPSSMWDLNNPYQFVNNGWQYFGLISDGNAAHQYRNSSIDITDTSKFGINISTSNSLVFGSDEITDPLRNYSGCLDEVRISNIARSSEWISTTYNNQNSPSTFYAISSENINYFSSATYTSSITDLEWNGGWGDGTDTSTAFQSDVTIPTGASIQFEARSAETQSGIDSATWIDLGTATSTGLYSKTALDLSSLPSGHNRYLQLRATLNAGSGGSPELNSYTFNYLADVDNPTANPTVNGYATSDKTTTLTDEDWAGGDPFFEFTDSADNDSGIEGYCLYLGTDNTANPETSKGLLGDSEQPADNSGCSYVTYNNYLDLSTALESDLVDGTTYYLNVRAKDYSGNMYTDTEYTEFTFMYDDNPPTNPVSLSAPQTYKNDIENFTIYWSTTGSNAAQDDGSGVKGYQYRIGDSGTWYGSGHTGTEGCNDIIEVGEYALDPEYDNLVTGENVIYLRTLDNACTVSTTSISAILKFSGDTPTEPLSVEADPIENTENLFSFSWSKPDSYSGLETGLSYCYTVNTLPSAQNCNWTENTYLTDGAYATQPGENTFYVVARDEAGNINYSAHSSATFSADTSAPGIVRNIEVADISIKATSKWQLNVLWEEPVDTATGVQAYRVYRSENGSSFEEVGNTSGTSYVDTGLEQKEYYYKVRACDSANNCGAESSVVSMTPTGRYYEPANLTTQPTLTNISSRSAKVSWITDRGSDSRIQYGKKSEEYFDEEITISDRTVTHEVNVNNLEPGTVYYFKAKWTDEDGNTGISEEKSFKTDPPPEVSKVKVEYVSLDNALISFTTKRAVKAKVIYGKSTSYGGTLEIDTSPVESSYTAQLKNLQDDTIYHFRIILEDVDGYEYEAIEDKQFKTIPRPRVSDITIEEVKGTAQPTVKVDWKSNTEISSIVEYYKISEPEETRDRIDLDLKTDHTVEIEGLEADTDYGLVVKGRDSIGNEAKSDLHTFTTATDSRPPEISQVMVEGQPLSSQEGEEAQAQLIVSWETDEPSTSQVEYGEGSGDFYTFKTQEDGELSYKHVMIISDLEAEKVYHLKVVSKDSAGNSVESDDIVSVTPKASIDAFDLVIQNLNEIFRFLKK